MIKELKRKRITQQQQPILFLHPDRDKIEIAIREGQSIPEMMARFGVARNALTRYMKRISLRELPDVTKALKELGDMGFDAEQVSENLPSAKIYGGIDLIEEIQTIRDKAEALGAKAENKGDYHAALAALREQSRGLDILIKMADKLRKKNDYNPWQHPDVIAYQEGLLQILRKHPEALNDVLDFLERTGSGSERLAEAGKAKPVRVISED